MPQGRYRPASQQKVDFRDFQTEPGLGYQGKFLDPSRKKDRALDRLGPEKKSCTLSLRDLIKYLVIRSPPSYPDSRVLSDIFWFTTDLDADGRTDGQQTDEQRI